MQWTDLQRIIAEEVSAALARGGAGKCACHSVLYDCCPDRVRGVVDAGASRLGLYAGDKVPEGVASLIDHDFTTGCINPDCVSLAAALLRGSASGVCTVVGCPRGATTTDVKQYETRRAIYDGAREIDMVINVGALKSGDLAFVERDIA